MAIDPIDNEGHTIDNPVYDDQGATGGYDPSETWRYKDETNLLLDTQMVKMAVDDFYIYFEEKGIKPGVIDYNDFELVNNKLKFKGSSIDLINKTTGKPLALSSIRSQQGGSAVLRSLGFYEYSKLSQKSVATLHTFNQKINQLNAKAAAVEMSELPEISREVDSSVVTMLNNIDAPIDGSEFTLRELRGLDKTMQAYRGELVNNLGK